LEALNFVMFVLHLRGLFIFVEKTTCKEISIIPIIFGEPDNTTGRRSLTSLEPPRVFQQFQIVLQVPFVLTTMLKVLEKESKIFSISTMWKRKLFTRLVISKIMFLSNHNADKPSGLTCNI